MLGGGLGDAAALGGGGGGGRGGEVDGGGSHLRGPVDLLVDDGVEPRGEGARQRHCPRRRDFAGGQEGLVAGVLSGGHHPRPLVRHGELHLAPLSLLWTLEHGVGAPGLPGIDLFLLHHRLHGGRGGGVDHVVPYALHQGPLLCSDRHRLPLDVVVPQRCPRPRMVHVHPHHLVFVDLVVLDRCVSPVLDPHPLHPVACDHVLCDESAAAGAADVDALRRVVADPVVLDLRRRP
mmetsp:Transcript_31080/g.99734  ORF Transcript_31080/g.99734 Transcript_31080/m.99734 type:complete len:234 (+) Transcript_31080:560-1261(+)